MAIVAARRPMYSQTVQRNVVRFEPVAVSMHSRQIAVATILWWEGSIQIWWQNLSWGGKFLAGWFGIAVAFWITVFVLSRFGIDPFSGYVADGREPFSRSECIRRHQNYYFERNPDMHELDDDKIAIVARACAVEEADYYYGTR